MPMTQTIDLDLDQVVIHTIRTLAMDAVQAANQDFAGTEEGMENAGAFDGDHPCPVDRRGRG